MSDVFADMNTAPVYPSYIKMAPKKNAGVTAAPQPVAAYSVKDSLNDADTVQLASQNSGKKKGPVKQVKGFIANVKKFFSNLAIYTGGVFKGVAAGAVAGSVVYTTGNLVNKVKVHNNAKTIAKEAGTKITAEIKEQAKNIKGKVPSGVLAGIAAVGALGIALWNASLDATQARSDIEHRWTGHEK